MGRIDAEIRPLAKAEIDLLERYLGFGPPEKHRERLAQQEEGQGVYLVAWHEGLPVGHLLLKWDGPSHEPMATELAHCPHIEDLFVSPDYRSRGVGSQLLAFAEDLVRRQGYTSVGLGVGVDNGRASSMYSRGGYKPSRFGTYRESGSYLDKEGSRRSWEETCIYLIKELLPSDSTPSQAET